jgi:hypothetical protein
MYIDRVVKFEGNEFTAFGRALHSLCEHLVVDTIAEEDYNEFFDMEFLKELQVLKGKVELRNNLVTDMRSQAKVIAPQIMPALGEYFEDYEVFSVEERLYEDIPDFDLKPYKFKGFIDLVLKIGDKYHIIDWKTCGWGWDAQKKSDKMITYQLTLYKKFFCIKHKVDPKLVETHFALLKRTSKIDNVELFRVTSGPKKTANATELLNIALTHISKQNHVKDRRACDRCDFRKSSFCP